MTLEEVKNKLDKLSFRSINFGHNVLNIAKSGDFENWQQGIRVDETGKTLISGKENGWQAQWYVIAKDSLEDPHFVDLNDGKVYTAIYEAGDWFPVPIADDFEHYIKILKTLKDFSAGRDTPAKFENNPLTEEQVDHLQETIQSDSEEDEEYHYWEYWLDE